MDGKLALGRKLGVCVVPLHIAPNFTSDTRKLEQLVYFLKISSALVQETKDFHIRRGGAFLFLFSGFSPAFLMLMLFLYFSYTFLFLFFSFSPSFLLLFLGLEREEKEKKRKRSEKKTEGKKKKRPPRPRVSLPGT